MRRTLLLVPLVLLVAVAAAAVCTRGICRGPIAQRPLIKDTQPGQLYTATNCADCADPSCTAGGLGAAVYQRTGSAWATIACLVPTTTTTSGATTTTTLPGCSTQDAACGTCGNGLCEPRLPGNALTCFDGSTCDLAPPADTCTDNSSCAAGKICIDATTLANQHACCAPCVPAPVCNSIVYCRCVDDDFSTTCGKCAGGTNAGNSCASGGDCPGGTCSEPDQAPCAPTGRICRVIDSSPDNLHCYHPTCTGDGTHGCGPDAVAACDAICAGLGGRFATFCADSQCVGGVNDGTPCDSEFATAECSGGACTGPQECSCTTTSTTATTTTTAP